MEVLMFIPSFLELEAYVNKCWPCSLTGLQVAPMGFGYELIDVRGRIQTDAMHANTPWAPQATNYTHVNFGLRCHTGAPTLMVGVWQWREAVRWG